MPYETYTKWSLEEARRLARALNLRTNKALWGLVAFAFLFFFVSSILYFIKGSVSSGVIMMFLALFMPVMVFIIMDLKVKAIYKSSKITQDAVLSFKFFEKEFSVTNMAGEFKIPYDKLFKIVETKTNFYLILDKSQAYPILKENCSSELISFLGGIK